MTACNKVQETSAYTRIVFNSDSLRVITSSVNKKLETMSILYGNDKAYDSALDSTGTHVPGEIFTFVTWQYHDNPFFYGSTINGELLSIESIHVNEGSAIDYKIDEGNPLPVNGVMLHQEERVKYILEHTPSLLP